MSALDLVLDHTGVAVRDLDVGQQKYDRLGFTLTERSFHSGSRTPAELSYGGLTSPGKRPGPGPCPRGTMWPGRGAPSSPAFHPPHCTPNDRCWRRQVSLGRMGYGRTWTPMNPPGPLMLMKSSKTKGDALPR